MHFPEISLTYKLRILNTSLVTEQYNITKKIIQCISNNEEHEGLNVFKHYLFFNKIKKLFSINPHFKKKKKTDIIYQCKIINISFALQKWYIHAIFYFIF